ncbi:MAG: transposase, partial [Acetobacteraceae bacterium]|nr:transposase [Acetobacteraceae bacterium]
MRVFDPRRRRFTPARRWQPLEDAEWDALLPFVLVREGPGRPLKDARRRMDALFWVAASGSAWRTVPPRFGRADTIGRHFRRLCHAGLWERLLKALARRLGLLSALRAPSHLLPKPDLSELVQRWLRRAAEGAREHGLDAETLDVLRFCHRLGRFAAGRKRLGRRFLRY